MNKPDFVFECRKCGHLVYTEATNYGVRQMIGADCPNCGEEGDIWVLIREGDYDKEFGNDNRRED